MELSLLLLEALDEWGVSPLLVLAITVHEVAINTALSCVYEYNYTR